MDSVDKSRKEDREKRVKVGDGLLFCGEIMARLIEDTTENIDFKKTQVMSDIQKLRRELLRVYKLTGEIWW